ncbi:alpha/beta fold hydrolase [Microbacterium rhizosphaerae]|uniref:Alpha/beta fold hydrolase n=1 Tax=Microbacterium rhizosphaerae TaxID=1678237 RepID=A0ABZ0SMR9_9MICO|nr:alpha/beta fold hydrolase [Microbacterium rhizosphaerae]WPR89465.1 alpha/beta fold hydrolase [Microbacterium rhizosphaerae]
MTPLVLLSGMNCTADLWTGCGFDDAVTPVLDVPAMDAQVERLLESLPDRFLLGGLSLGAIVAMAMILRAPERVAGLFLVSTNAKAPTAAQRAGWDDWLRQLDAGVSPVDLQGGLLPMLLSASAVRPDLVARTLAMGEETGAEVLHMQLRLQGTRVDLLPQLPAVTAPTLVVSGAQDAICPPSFHTEIADAIPGAELVTLDGGHLLPLEQPEAFGEVVGAWRSRLDR